MSSIDIISWLQVLLASGIMMEATDDGYLLVTDHENQLSPEELAWLKEHKAEILGWFESDRAGWSIPVADASVKGLRHCQADGCWGWIDVNAGRGTCDLCGLAHVFVEPGWHTRVFESETEQ